MDFDFEEIEKIKRGFKIFFQVLVLLILFSLLGYFSANNQEFLAEEKNERQEKLLDDYFPSAYNGIWFQREHIKLRENSGQPQLSANAYLSVYISESGLRQILTEKNAAQKLPIASITKLMSALVASDKLGWDWHIEIPTPAASGKGSLGRFDSGGKFALKDLLASLLIESDNDAAVALADAIGEERFIKAMNSRAEELGMAGTRYYNPTGLDPDKGAKEINVSTANDIFLLLNYLSEQRQDILGLTSLKEYKIFDVAGRKHHIAKTTDSLLISEDLASRVIGAKTGQTPRARMNLVVALKPLKRAGKIINVVLNSDHSFRDMRELVRWLDAAYRW